MPNVTQGGIVALVIDGANFPVFDASELQIRNVDVKMLSGLSGNLGNTTTPMPVKYDVTVIGLPAATLQRIANGEFVNVVLTVTTNAGKNYTMDGAAITGEVTQTLDNGAVKLTLEGDRWTITDTTPATVAAP